MKHKMKRICTGILMTALLITAIGGAAFAAGGRGRNYVDVNYDGICDNMGTNCGSNYVDANGDGICDNSGTGCGHNYVDANGDGICDNLGTSICTGRGGRRGGCQR